MTKQITEQASRALALTMLNDDPDALKGWLTSVADTCTTRIQSLASTPDEKLSTEDADLLAVMEPFLFLVGIAYENNWLTKEWE